MIHAICKVLQNAKYLFCGIATGLRPMIILFAPQYLTKIYFQKDEDICINGSFFLESIKFNL